MITQLPRWVEYGAFLLALVAGCINAIGLLGVEHQAISHLSGTATLMGAALISDHPSAVLHLVGIVLSFLLGSTLCGFMLPGNALLLGRHYDTTLLIEALLLCGALLFLNQDVYIGHYLASAACGLQNALATNYSGAIVRTTHLTGIVTDLGLMLGARCRKEPLDRRKGMLFVLIIGGFVLGAALGAWLFQQVQFYAMLVPAALCLLLAALYRYTRQRTTSPGL
ncbi:DUF1275 domain-containing protein [Aestuariibacter halophilus]|uniref:DUF1275 domain-containing protein n=1 Tax=Fluctibacter halophilus TaxID=226011 RepID=A0ABS8G8L5_9ALTE|nr:YoaK family protein [Aestuariibacter halophilus]MCC2616880.1 DUF1275 domain-containing protein [Aestuariibacter halophilus]